MKFSNNNHMTQPTQTKKYKTTKSKETSDQTIKFTKKLS